MVNYIYAILNGNQVVRYKLHEASHHELVATFTTTDEAEEYAENKNEEQRIKAFYADPQNRMPPIDPKTLDRLKYDNRTNRLKRLIELEAPEMIVANECILVLLAVYGDHKTMLSALMRQSAESALLNDRLEPESNHN